MEDLLFVLGLVAFFALCLAYIRFCDSVIGPESADAPSTTSGERDRVDTAVG